MSRHFVEVSVRCSERDLFRVAKVLSEIGIESADIVPFDAYPTSQDDLFAGDDRSRGIGISTSRQYSRMEGVNRSESWS